MKDGERKTGRGAVVLHLNARRKSAKPGEAPADARAILARAGLSEAALTPAVKRTLGALAASRGSRRELNAALSRIGALERLVGEDQPVPIRSRRAFLRELARMAAFAERYGMPASLVCFDVEGMKGINDRHGHEAGDAVLDEIGRLLVEHVRMSDMVGRLGGDEFGVLLMRTEAPHAERKAKELAAAVTCDGPLPKSSSKERRKAASGATSSVPIRIVKYSGGALRSLPLRASSLMRW